MASTATGSAQGPASTQEVSTLLRGLHAADQAVRQDAVSALKAFDRGAVIDSLSRLLTHQDPESRCDAAEALLRIDADRTIDLVLPLLSDISSVVRWHTCGLLHDFGDRRAIPGLVRVLLNDGEPDVRLFAADALGEIGDQSALAALQQASKTDAGEDYEGRRVRDAAAAAIESIAAREA
jgi:HEAT repeat protein